MTHQDEVDDGEDGRPEAGVDREDDEPEDHLPGAAMCLFSKWRMAEMKGGSPTSGT